MDREIESTIQEKMKIRKAVMPVLEDLFDKSKEAYLDKIESHTNTNILEGIAKSVKETPTLLKSLQGVFDKAISKIKYPSDMKVSGDVNVLNKDVQKVEGGVSVIGEVDVNTSKLETLLGKLLKKEPKVPDNQKVSVEGLVHGEMKATNLPIGKGTEVNKKDANPSNYLVVRLTDGQKFQGIPGSTMSAGGGATMEKVWLRQEFTYTTISGNRVPTKIESWDDQFKLTEDFEYEYILIDGEDSVNPIIKSRSLEPSSGVGI